MWFIGTPLIYANFLEYSGYRMKFLNQMRPLVSGPLTMLPEIFQTILRTAGVSSIEWKCIPEARMVFSNSCDVRRTSDFVSFSLPGIEVRIVDPITGFDLVPGRPGEIWLKGATITPSCLIDSSKTKNSFVGEWFRSGYLGSLEKDGRFHLTANLVE